MEPAHPADRARHAILLLAGFAAVLALEWTRTLQPFGFAENILVAAFQGTMPGTAAFDSPDPTVSTTH